MGVLGGILAGIIAGLLYNRYRDVKLPEWLAFFSGRRFVPIVTSVAMVILAGIASFVWPPIQDGINGLGNWIIGLGAIGSGIFGFLNRLLIPLGLHHVLNSLFWFQLGEFAGKTGDIAHFFADDSKAGAYMTVFFPIIIFGLPAAAFVVIATAKPEKKKATFGMFVGLALTSFLTSVTDKSHPKVFIVDDSSFYRNRSKKVELLARCFDHASLKMRFYKCFRMLTLGWSDGYTFMPIDFSLLSSKKAQINGISE